MKKTNARITMYAVPATVYTAAPGIGSLKNVPAGARRRTVSMPAALSAAAPRMIKVASQGSMTPDARKAAPYPGSGLHASDANFRDHVGCQLLGLARAADRK